MMELKTITDINSLIDKVLHGEAAGRELLAAYAQEKLRPYIYRMTLQDDLTQDIVQETLIEMFKVLGKLQDKDKFWPWLRGIAFNKLRGHYRKEKRQKELVETAARFTQGRSSQEGLRQIITHELEQIVMNAMKQMKASYRAVLTMRCYEQMDYEQIAEVMGSSEFATRMLFMRAKRALAKELSRNGLKQGAMLSALIVFGKITAGNSAVAAQVQVTPATLSVGPMAALAGFAGSSAGLISAITACLVITSATVYHHHDATNSALGSFNIHGTVASEFSQMITLPREYETWYYYPDGVGGPVMTRITGNGGQSGQAYWLQNDLYNYAYNPQSGRVNICNFHYLNPDLSVMRLPGDSSQMTAFLDGQGGRQSGIEYHRDRSNDLLVRVNNGSGERPVIIDTAYNPQTLQEEYFCYNWSDNVKAVDQRDSLHKQGWASFKVTGQLNGQSVRGWGEIPLVYGQMKQHKPRLWLSIGPDIQIADTVAGSGLYFTSKGESRGCQPGYFFRTLSRPWMGLHTLDSIRRDAAGCRIPFKTVLMESGKAAVQMTDTVNNKLQLTYLVDLENDLLLSITAEAGGAERARLSFEYGNKTTDVRNEMKSPGASGVRMNADGLWLLDLLR